MLTYEVLMIEDGIYYIRYYPFPESRGIDLKLSREDYLKWIEDDKVEI